jgi:hypothetical protein
MEDKPMTATEVKQRIKEWDSQRDSIVSKILTPYIKIVQRIIERNKND